MRRSPVIIIIAMLGMLVSYNNCSNSVGDLSQSSASLSSIAVESSYNPYFSYRGGEVFVDPDLHNGVQGNFYYREFCVNEEQQIDFTIQYLQEEVQGSTDVMEDWVGLVFYGPKNRQTGLHFNGGFFEEAPDGSKRFWAENDLYEVIIEANQGAGPSEAFLVHKNGTRIAMTCQVAQ